MLRNPHILTAAVLLATAPLVPATLDYNEPMQQDPTVAILINKFVSFAIITMGPGPLATISSWLVLVYVEMDTRYHLFLLVKHGSNGHGSVGSETILGGAYHHPILTFHPPLRVTILRLTLH